MQKSGITLLIIFLLSVAGLSDARAEPPASEFLYGFSLNSLAGTSGEAPFWLHANRYGKFDQFSNNTTLTLFGSSDYQFDSGLSFSTGVDLLFRAADDAVVRFQQAYLQLGYGHFTLSGGRRYEEIGFVNRSLTTGSLDLTQNARPIPRITLSTDKMREVPGTGGFLNYKGSLSHGWMDDDDDRYVTNSYFHKKYLYLQIFSEEAPVVPRGGLVHYALWAGESPDHGTLPSDFGAYRDVFFSLARDSREILGGGQLPNRYQNHGGTYDFSLIFNIDSHRLVLNRQFILEDTPNARFGTPFDGLWAATLELRPDSRTFWRGERPSDWNFDHRPFLKSIHYEHLNTREGLSRYSHRDETSYFNYYNHSSFRGGWTYEGRTVGNPLLYTDPDFIGVANNLLIGHHLASMGHAGPVDWRFFTTYTRNYGASRLTRRENGQRTFDPLDNERRDQWSFMLELQSSYSELFSDAADPNSILNPLELSLTMAYDAGDVYANQLGLMIGLRWEGGR